MAVQIQLRRGTAAQWTSANPTLASGEVGFETDTNKEKIGDGTTAWNSLAYFGGGSPGGNPGQIQYNNAGSFGGDANLTFSGSTTTAANLIVSNLTGSLAVFSSSTKQLVSNPITGTGSVVMNSSPTITSPSLITPALGSPTSGNMAATTNIPVANATGTLVVGNGGTGLTTIPSGNVVIGNGTSALYGLAPGTAGNVLTSIGGAWVSNAAVGGSATPGGNTTEFQYNNGGAFAGAANLTTDGANTTIRSANTFRFANLTSTRYVGFKANAIIAANVTWTLPVADGTSGQSLTTDGAGNLSWGTAAPTAPPTVEYLVVAGGGGGGADFFVGRGTGGGGAGGYLTATGYAVTAGTPINVTVGGGGAGGSVSTTGNNGNNGTPSAFGSISTAGGGGGQGHVTTPPVTPPYSGGSGGGARNGFPGAPGTAGQGNAGGNGNADTSPFTGGGGGGAGGLGGNAVTSVAGNGGLGLNWNSLGTFYAGGGGAGASSGGTAGSGGSSIGGAGAVEPSSGNNASPANRGSGGGGGVSFGGNGSGGIVIVRYADTYAAAASSTGSPTITTSGGFRYYTWTGNGSITF